MCLDCGRKIPSTYGVSEGGGTIFVRLFVLLIRGYQYLVSPLFPATCRYIPTCSQYAVEAVSRYGVFRGVILALWRILRCHPFARGGYDPLD